MAQWALRLQDTQDRLFWDSAGGGYFCSEAELGAVHAASEGRSVRVLGAGLGYWTHGLGFSWEE